MSEHCNQHQRQMDLVGTLSTDIAVIKRDLERFLHRVELHIQEGEKQGGVRDRLYDAESEIRRLDTDIRRIEIDIQNNLITGRWFMIGSGVISGIVVLGGWQFLKELLGVLR